MQQKKKKKHSVVLSSSTAYKKHLLKYALQKKRLLEKEQTFTVRKSGETIFSQDSKLLKLRRFLEILFSARLVSLLLLVISPITVLYESFLITLRSIRLVLREVKKLTNKLWRALTYPYRKSWRLVARWNRKKTWQFRKKVRASLVAEPEEKTTRTTIFSALTYLFKPFYYTVRLFPVHTAIALLLSAGILSGTWVTHEYIFKDLPDAEDLTRVQPPVTTKILDRNGEVLFRLYEDENRTIVPLSEISPYVIDATIAIEDQEFYSHHGFSIKGIFRAMVANYQGLPTQGGSTITQQLVKNRLLSPEQTLQRKIRELILAILIEGMYEKEQILEMYLNQVAYGGSTYGIEEAAQRYFGKSAKELGLAEAAILAGLPAAPSAYTPFGPNPELAKARQVEVLRRMVEDGMITQEQADEATHKQLAFKNDVIDIKAPHFVMYVKKLLADKYGEDVLYQGGLEIRTTLDLDLQNETQQKVTDEINSLARLRVTNGAALVTNPESGEIYAMVGSKDYFDFEHDGQVNVTIRPRQPGSSIKPLTYAIALEQGNTVSTIIQDQPITFNIAGSKPYSPQNYDGKFHGNVTLKESLASSYNIPAVKMLNQVGVDTLIDKATAMGITTWQDRRRFGLSLTLGGGEVLMIDMAKAYGAFANEGYVTDLNPILEIHNYQGEELYRNTCALDGLGCFRKKVLDSKVAFLISNILSDNSARTPAFGPMSTLVIPGQEVAVKTGTTNNLRDNWTIGYTSDRLVAVWVGNNDNTPMSYVASGVTGASPIWNDIMSALLDENEPHAFDVPAGVIKVASCRAGKDGQPCTTGCVGGKEEYYIAGTEPRNVCNIAGSAAANRQENAKPEEEFGVGGFRPIIGRTP